ncbi:HAMP domain-containing sensor histidine kinase [Pseudomonas sp. App30]|uniref:sensor histidine kinase n=1 Tax=Pseudomonas sp. App30 TaxID=3068990 RepID=UPI003A808ACE
MKFLSLSQRLSLVFAALLLACSGVAIWLQISASTRHEQEVVQRLSSGLAAHIAGTAQLMDASGWRPEAVHELFDKLMAVNPSVELYLLSRDGRIVGNGAPDDNLKRKTVDLGPVHKFLEGAALPVLGQDPRNLAVDKVFSAAPVQVGGRDGGYVYVVLQGEAHDALAAALARDSTLRVALWTMCFMVVLSLIMGLVAFRLITRPLKALTQTVREFDANGHKAAALTAQPVDKGDEIGVLSAAFAQMGQRIAEQWQELTRQDQQRRDLVANISHDLRTPLTSLHGYLETLRIKDESLSAEERRHYLDVALGQSRKVGRLAQELFELARLESGLVHPQAETFALPDLVQDVLQKFELAAEARQQHLEVDMPQALPAVNADLGMIERVLTNLLDNAIRHNPPGTRIIVRLLGEATEVQVAIIDTGKGIAPELRAGLFTRASAMSRSSPESGGLGLIIVKRMLQLHGSDIQLGAGTPSGTVMSFQLSTAQ